jgi:hypothetical protein
MKNTNIIRIAFITVGILLIPLIAMRFTGEVNWNISDFVVMGTMIFVTGLLIDFLRKRMGKYKIVGIFTVLLLFLWLWAELAVGVFTNWGS